MLDLFQELRPRLASIIGEGITGTPQSVAFAVRILGLRTVREIVPDWRTERSINPEEALYTGYPPVAQLGFGLGSDGIALDVMPDAFVTGLRRLRQRSAASLSALAADDVALLGIADGLGKLDSESVDQSGDLRDWLIGILDRAPPMAHWTARMRSLAGDLLDNRGRLRMLPSLHDVDALSLEFALRATWVRNFADVPSPGEEERRRLLRLLLQEPAPFDGDVERAAVRLKALDIILDYACVAICPSVSDTARILSNVQHSFKRWKWETSSNRKGTMPTQWLIDDEYDVQALLWAVLYPIYQPDLVDESYLPNWGHVQLRADLGITSLKLIIEVKIARQPADFKKIEEEVAGDLGLYFKDTDQFDRLMVFVYDDCDDHKPERHDGLRNALKKRARVEDVVFVRRPSMIPNRRARRSS